MNYNTTFLVVKSSPVYSDVCGKVYKNGIELYGKAEILMKQEPIRHFPWILLPQEYTAYGNGDYRINGLTVLEECHHMYHGEKVAFGTLAQLVLENVPHEELEEIIMWCIEVGLPVTLEELGAGNVTDEQLMEVAKAASAEGDTLQNMPFTVTPESVFAAIKAADAYGRYYLGEE
mgnify:CR=1 FL=1